MKAAIIINPTAGGRRAGHMWKMIGDEVRSRLGGVQEFVTTKSGDATRFANQVAQTGFDMLIVAGGDGTINEVVNGLFTEKNVAINPELKLGIISSGRGCDFIRSVNIPNDFRAAMDVLVNPAFRKIDIGCVYFKDEFGREGRRLFHNIASAGLAGLVAKRVHHTPRFIPPGLTYFGNMAASFLTTESFFLKVSVDDKIVYDGKILNIFVANGAYSGAGMCWAPMAKPDDGIFEVIIGEPLPKSRILLSAHKLYDGSFINMPGIHHYRGKTVVLETDDDVYLEVDGEQPGRAPAIFSILPGAINLAVSP